MRKLLLGSTDDWYVCDSFGARDQMDQMDQNGSRRQKDKDHESSYTYVYIYIHMTINQLGAKIKW